MSQPKPNKAQSAAMARFQAAAAYDECTILLRALDGLSAKAAKLLAVKLEGVHFAVQCESDYDPDAHMTFCLNDLDVLDAVRLYLETSHEVPCLSSDDIETKYRPKFERKNRKGA